MNLKKPHIFEYTNYRLFLKDLYDYLKETTDYFSYRYFSKKAGFKSPNYLKLVIEDARNISDDSIERFSVALKFNKNEAQFFSQLVNFNQAENNTERAEFALKILRSKVYQKIHPLKEEQMNYYQRWYQIGIRELALCDGFKNDYEWIAKQFKPELKPKQAKLAVESLIKMGMLAKDKKSGKLKACDTNIITTDEVTSSLVAGYHKEMMERAKESIDICSALEREVSSICVPVSEETFNEMKKRIQDFRKDLIALATNDKNPNQVYQLNMQLFPVTKKVEPS